MAGGTFTVDLSAAADVFDVQWLSIRTGTYRDGTIINGGASESLKAPFAGPAVVYIKKAK